MVTSAHDRHNKAAQKKEDVPLLAKSMRVSDILALCPDAEPVLAEYGLHCFRCAANEFETLEDGCLSHGFEEDEIDELVDDLNELMRNQPDRPQTLTVTEAAARAIEGVAVAEGKAGEGLAVIVDGHGGFCMEFRKEPEQDEQTFINDAVPTVRIFASTTTLRRIGGSTIDFRDERFKLDLAEDAGKGACGCGGSCSCARES